MVVGVEDADEVAEDVLFFIDPAHLRNFGGSDSLKEEHLLVGDIREFMSNFFLIGASTGVDVAHEEGGGNSAGEISLIAGEAHDLDRGGGTRGIM